MKKVLVTGGAGFIGSYVCEELLASRYEVTVVDNFSKYGRVEREFFNADGFNLIEGDCLDSELMKELALDCNYVIANAAMIGGISYFHKHAYDLLSINEKITANTFDACLNSAKNGLLERIIVMSSSMVFESGDQFPSYEDDIRSIPPPLSTYGFQKLSCEYFAKGAWEQYKLPYTIVRPFNCVGVGEGKSISKDEYSSGEIKLAMSHVLPDLAQKCLRGQDPLHILGDGSQIRCYTHGKDIARAIRMIIESPKAVNETFNISTKRATTVKELAELVWLEVKGDNNCRLVSDAPFEYDVKKRIPAVNKARQILGFETQIDLEDSVKEVVGWVRDAINEGKI